MTETTPPAGPPAPVQVVDGYNGRKVNNALTITFVQDGTSVPFAKAQQGKGDGAGKKLGILFGFKNYAVGTHVLTYADEAAGTLVVACHDEAPTQVTRGDGTAVATITRGDTTVATLPDGTTLLTFGPDAVEHVTDDRYRLAVSDAEGALIGTLDLVRSHEGFDSEGLRDYVIGGLTGQGWSIISTDTGGSLPNHFLGTRLILVREPTAVEREVLLAASTELGLSARCYTPAMGKGAAWG